MGSAEATAFLKQMQKALQVLTALQLTAYLYPPNAMVNDGESFDFIVVGAGTAGSVVANRLSRNPAINVLLVEAGGDAPLESDLPGPIYLLKKSIHDWNYHAEPDKYFDQCHQNPYFEMAAGKMLGGTSSLNYMIYDRGTPKDFNSWAKQVDDPTWRWENVVPYYEKTAQIQDPSNVILNNGTKDYLTYIKVEGDTSNFLKSFNEVGYEIENTDDGAVNTYYKLRLTMSNGERESSATTFLTPIKTRKNLKVLKNTNVNKILFDENKNAIGIEAVTKEGKTLTVKSTKEIIVSAGAINSPKLLMLSGIGPKEHLKDHNINVISDLPVGNNLQDQVSASVVHDMEGLEYAPLNPHSYPSVAIGGFVGLDKSKDRDYQTLSFVTEGEIVRAFCTLVLLYKNEVCDAFYDSGYGRLQAFNQIIKLNPKSRGKIMLRSASPADPPLIDPRYLENPEDLEDLARYIIQFAKVMNTTYYTSVNASMAIPQNLKCGELVQDSMEYWKCYASCMVSGMSYFTSSCAMGPVLDSNLRVRGVQKLRVVDASIMPTGISGNPYGTVVMIGEKASEFIIKQHNL